MNHLPKSAIALDADEVLLDWRGAFCRYLIGRGYRNLKPLEDIRIQSITSCFEGMTPNDFRPLMEAFHVDPSYRDIPLLPGALAGVARLREIFRSRSRLIAVTLAGDDPRSHAMRREALAPFGFDAIHTLPFRTKKPPTLRAEHALLLIDDHIRNVTQARAAGISAILFATPSNEDTNDPSKAYGWDEVATLARTVLWDRLFVPKKL